MPDVRRRTFLCTRHCVSLGRLNARPSLRTRTQACRCPCQRGQRSSDCYKRELTCMYQNLRACMLRSKGERQDERRHAGPSTRPLRQGRGTTRRQLSHLQRGASEIELMISQTLTGDSAMPASLRTVSSSRAQGPPPRPLLDVPGPRLVPERGVPRRRGGAPEKWSLH